MRMDDVVDVDVVVDFGKAVVSVMGGIVDVTDVEDAVVDVAV